MTAILAFKHDTGITIASDSYVGFGESQQMTEDEPKYWPQGDMVIGAAGSIRACVSIQQLPKLRRPHRKEGRGTYLSAVWGVAARQALRESDVQPGEFEAIIVWRGDVWVVDSECCATRPTCGYATVGSARDVLRGLLAMSLKKDQAMNPHDRAKEVLELAQEHCSGILPGWHVRTVKNQTQSRTSVSTLRVVP